MKTIVRKFNVYTIEELKAVNADGYEKAVEDNREWYIANIAQDNIQLFVESMTAFANELNVKMQDYSIGLYSVVNYMFIDEDAYMNLGNETKNENVALVNEMLKNHDYSLTGDYTDFYIKRYFIDKGITEVNYNDLHKRLPAVFDYAVNAFVNDLESDVNDDSVIIDCLIDNDMLFYVDGTMYEPMTDDKTICDIDESYTQAAYKVMKESDLINVLTFVGVEFDSEYNAELLTFELNEYPDMYIYVEYNNADKDILISAYKSATGNRL